MRDLTGMRSIFLSVLILVSSASLSGCSHVVTHDNGPNVVRESEIVDFMFEDISIPVGSTIVWINMDQKAHSVTSGIPPDQSGVWDSPFLRENERFSFLFMETGQFNYWCRAHPFMIATVTVEN